MPYQKYNSNAPSVTSDAQFLDWIQEIQVKYLEAVSNGRRHGFRMGSNDCDVMGNLLDREHMAKFLTPGDRMTEFVGFIERLEEFLKSGGGTGTINTGTDMNVRTYVTEMVVTEQPQEQTGLGWFGSTPLPQQGGSSDDVFFGS